MEDLFTPKTLSFLKEAIGGVEILSNKKVITCSIVLSVSEDHLDDLRIANREEDCINPPEDAFLYMFLRAYCASLLGTGKTLREEGGISTSEPPKFWGNTDIERFFYHGADASKEFPANIENLPAKPMLVMTRQLVSQELTDIPFYRNLAYHKQIQQTPDLERKAKDPEFCELLKKQRISIVKDPISDFSDALNYLLNTQKYENVLVEAGPSITGRYLEGEYGCESPFDLIVLTVYSGKAKESWYGPGFPSMKKMLVNHKLVHESVALPCGEGKLRFYVLAKKDTKP